MDMVRFADTDRKAGTYRARFVKLDTEFPIPDRDGGEDVIRWRWVFQEVADSTTVGELDTISSPGFKARSNGRKFLTGMLGREPTLQDDTDDLVGQEFDVLWGPNQAGRLTIVAVTRPTNQSAAAPAAASVPPDGAAVPAPPDELPF